MKKNNAKRSLMVSVLAMLLCCAMLVGTTFAWFTDSVSTGRNTIKSGNLDVVLEYSTDGENWTEVGLNTVIFDKEALWEPGYTQVVAFRVTNAGSLALKYNLNTVVIEEKISTNVADKTFKLSDYLVVRAQEMEAALIKELLADRDKANAAQMISYNFGDNLAEGMQLLADEQDLILLCITMPTTVGNEANHKTGEEAPSIDFGINLLATQLTYEKDSFGEDYDEDAEYPISYDYHVDSVEGLKEAFAEGGTVQLTADIEVDNMMKIAEGAEVYLDLNGKTIEFERDALSFNPGNPIFYPLAGSKLTITGNGIIDLGDNYDAALVYPAGEVIIENGTFIRNRVPDGVSADEVQTLFMGVKSAGSKLVINGGYFDSGYYDKNADLVFSETEADIANRGKAADQNLYRTAIKNNCSIAFNLSWSSDVGTQNFKIYGGTFVGANPAWGDEGCAMPITPNYLRPWSYYQGMFLEGQVMYDDKIEIPDGYTITESKTDDGRPVFTVTYSK